MGRNYFYILHRDIGKEEVLLFWGSHENMGDRIYRI